MDEIHEVRKPAPSLLNRSMLSAKLFNLLYGASFTSLMPFLPMFYRFLGLTAFQNGLLGSARSLVAFWSSVLWCILAEKLGKRKCMLVIFLLTGIVLNVSLGLVSSPLSNFGNYNCRNNRTELRNSSKRTVPFYDGSEGFKETVPPINGESKQKLETDNQVEIHPAMVLHNQSLRATSTISPTRQENQYKRSADTHNKMTNISQLKQNSTNERSDYIYHAFGFRMDQTFRTLLIITLVAEFFMSPVRRICESIFADVIHSNKGKKRRSNIWSTLGKMLGAGLVILVIGHYHCSFHLTNTFYLHFYLYAIIGAGSFVFASLFHVYEPKTSMTFKFCRSCQFVTCDLGMQSYLTILMVLGMAESLTTNFMMWYLQDIKASLTLMGLMLVFAALSELLSNCLTPYFIKWFGHNIVITMALSIYGGRFLGYSYLTDPWLVLPLQLLHGFSFSSIWIVCSSYSSLIAPIGMERTLNSIMSITFWGVGHGAGGVGTALLYYIYGPVVIFRCAAGVCGVYCLLFAVLHLILIIPGNKTHGKLMEYRQVTFDIDDRRRGNGHVQDWLLEALEAEEDDDDEDTHFIR